MADVIRLSGKEVSGLAARVFASAFMPAGAVGSASEAVEFLELTGQEGLAELNREKDMLIGKRWQAPAILEEGLNYAVCDGGASPAPYYFAALADWLAAMATSNGSAAIVLRGVTFGRYLHAVPHLLARRGLCGFVSKLGRDAAEGSLVSLDGVEWIYRRLKDFNPDDRALPQALPGPRPSDGDALLVAARPSVLDLQPLYVSGVTRGELSSGAYAKIKRAILASGWPIEPELWASLMTFADRSLIKTSEHSRLGAG